MRNTRLWAMRRQAAYFGFFGVVILITIALLYYKYFYTEPTCFDNSMNQDETGVDCGGSCLRICPFEVTKPVVKWARSFKVTDGQYNAVAYVENLNRVAATPEVSYTFSLYDEKGLILERKGTTLLPPNSVYPIFEGRIFTNGRVPTRTFLEIEDPELWQPATSGREQFTIVDRELISADYKPKINAVIRNNSLEEAREVEVVATIFDTKGVALASSETFVSNFAPRSETDVVFTWPEPIATTLRSCEIPTDIVLAIDVSGSMNSDSKNPPQPLTSVKIAANQFAARLNDDDQLSLVSFATEAELLSSLSNSIGSVQNLIDALIITPEEEVGSTNTGDAIAVGGNELVSTRHNPDARKVMVLLTDGLATAPDENPEEHALTNARFVKQSGVELYTIGLGQQVNMEFVRTLATSPEYAYQALTSDDVDSIYQTITSSLCEEGAAVIDIIPKTGASFTPLR